MNKLERYRLEINEIDKELARLFNERMHIVKKIKAYKKENNLQIYDKDRENYLIEENLKYVDKEYQDLFRKVEVNFLDLSKEYQKQ